MVFALHTFLLFTLIIANTRPLHRPPPSIDGQQIAIIILAGLFCFFTVSLFTAHTRLIILNVTTIEDMGISRMKARERSALQRAYLFWRWREKRRAKKVWNYQWGRIGKEGNFWWLGSARANWEMVMGNDKLGWFLPIPASPTGDDGLSYVPNPRFSKKGLWRMSADLVIRTQDSAARLDGAPLRGVGSLLLSTRSQLLDVERTMADDWATFGADATPTFKPINPKLGDLLSSCSKLKRLYLHGARRIHHEWLLSPALNNLDSLDFQNSDFEIELDAPFQFQLKEFGTDTLSPPAFKRLLQDAVPPPSEGPIPARLPALKSLDLSKVRFTTKEELKELLDNIEPLAPTLRHFGIPEFLHAGHYSYFRPSALPKEVPEDTIAFLQKTTECLKSLVVPSGIQENVKYYLHHLAGFARLDRLSVHLFDDTTMPILSQFINEPILRTARVIEVRDQELESVKSSEAGKKMLKDIRRNNTQLQTNDTFGITDWMKGYRWYHRERNAESDDDD
ncbi:vacuole protein, palmitoyltransferase domain containing [Pseudohyphozyma bogoriensis]|nr:vacuole protein, palmitoyltransferase domain containing [Pseudohyphozyma bogoriensis]